MSENHFADLHRGSVRLFGKCPSTISWGQVETRFKHVIMVSVNRVVLLSVSNVFAGVKFVASFFPVWQTASEVRHVTFQVLSGNLVNFQ